MSPSKILWAVILFTLALPGIGAACISGFGDPRFSGPDPLFVFHAISVLQRRLQPWAIPLPFPVQSGSTS